jgi:hypothetical protein
MTIQVVGQLVGVHDRETRCIAFSGYDPSDNIFKIYFPFDMLILLIHSSGTIGIGLSPCSVPGSGPSFQLGDDEMELGLGEYYQVRICP